MYRLVHYANLAPTDLSLSPPIVPLRYHVQINGPAILTTARAKPGTSGRLLLRDFSLEDAYVSLAAPLRDTAYAERLVAGGLSLATKLPDSYFVTPTWPGPPPSELLKGYLREAGHVVKSKSLKALAEWEHRMDADGVSWYGGD